MSIKSKVLAAAATLSLVGGVGAAAAMTSGSAQAATPSAGANAVNFFNHEIGRNFLLDDFKRSTAIGNPVILFQKSNFDPALDWSIFEEATVHQFFLAGLVSAAFDLQYGADVAIEIQYTPYGVGTGECAGLAATATQGEKVTLQPCGVSSKTVWALDFTDPQFLFAPNKFVLANGSTTTFSFPYSLTYPSGANPIDKPRVAVDVERLTGFFGQFPPTGTPTGPANDNQQWNAFLGVVH